MFQCSPSGSGCHIVYVPLTVYNYVYYLAFAGQRTCRLGFENLLFHFSPIYSVQVIVVVHL